MKIISIDPGRSGGISSWDELSTKVYNMPQTVGDLIDFFKAFDREYVVVMEEVTGFIRGNPAPGSRMFNFGRGIGQLEGVIQALGFRLELVRAQKWQKALSLHKDKDMKPAEWKRKLRAEAQRLYPNVKVTLQNADTLLILEYRRRRNEPERKDTGREE